MSRIDTLFKKLTEKKQKGFIAYITAGDPDIQFTESVIYKLDKCGVDLLEIGVPFSDPLADGPVIQEASDRALIHHTNLDQIFALIRKVRQNTQIPLILFTYLNPLYQFGIEKFAQCARETGVDGALVLDLPVEESAQYRQLMKKQGLDTIFIIAPTTDKNRIKMVAEMSSGFIYYVSHTGVTGETSSIASELADNVRMIKSMTDKPVAVGFGISNPEHVKTISRCGDAVVVGSAIVRRVKEYQHEKDGPEKVARFVSTLLAPLKQQE